MLHTLAPFPPPSQTVGLDDNWQACGAYGPNKNTYHDVNGNPVVNTKRFPSMSNMTAYAHSLGLKAGWCVAALPCHALPRCPPNAHPRTPPPLFQVREREHLDDTQPGAPSFYCVN